MPVYTSEALILRTYKLGEVDRIVVFLTRDRGKKSGVRKVLVGRGRVHRRARAMTRAGVALLRARTAGFWSHQLIEPTRSPSRHRAARRWATSVILRRLIDEWAPGDADERLYRLGSSDDRRHCGGCAVWNRSRAISSTGCCGCRGVSASSRARIAEPLLSGAVMPARDDLFVCPTGAPAGGTSVGVEALSS